MTKIRAISLFSGGLDSICATRLVMAQSIEVVAVKFVSPFFGDDIIDDVEGYQTGIREKFGIEVQVVDISDDYLHMLRNPVHGFGRYFNPCIDCKVLMLEKAKSMLAQYQASFLVTGEVLGQRPMSQRRDTLNVISRDSGSRPILVRPLSAKLMAPTEAEERGWIDREKLRDFRGRGRSRQIELAASFGITEYPPPAGGCVLADPMLSRRIARVYEGTFPFTADEMTVQDIRLMLLGRHFLLPGGGWLVVGRDEKENDRLDSLAGPADLRLHIEERPGPFGLLRRGAVCYKNGKDKEEDLGHGASVITRYAKKVGGVPAPGMVIVTQGEDVVELVGMPCADDNMKNWVI
jgi:tRNA-specific 2-thiouridylase